MGSRSKLLLETWIIASLMTFINAIIALTIHISTSTNFDFFTAANLMIPEFGVMLILGACLMSRQPLDDEKRHDADGNPTKSWRFALLGKTILLASFFLLSFSGLFYLLGLVFPP
jgi:hypothetical protein